MLREHQGNLQYTSEALLASQGEGREAPQVSSPVVAQGCCMHVVCAPVPPSKFLPTVLAEPCRAGYAKRPGLAGRRARTGLAGGCCILHASMCQLRAS